MLSQGQFFDAGQYSMSPTNAHVITARQDAAAELPKYRRGGTKDPIENGFGQDVGRFNTPGERIEMRTRKYYHGTNAAVPVGGYIEPGYKHGRDNYDMGRNESVFMTTNLDAAATWSRRAGEYGEVDPTETTYVHEVEPEGIEDVHHRMTPEHQAHRAKVVKRYAVNLAKGNWYGDSLVKADRNAKPDPTVTQPGLF